MIEIRTYSDEDREEVIRLVLHCQNDGTRPFVSVDDQPELLHIQEKYMDSGGNFWVAKDDGKNSGQHRPDEVWRWDRCFKKILRL